MHALLRSFALALAVAACATTTDPATPVVLDARLAVPAAMPLARTLSLTLAAPATVTVEYWPAEGGAHLEVRSAAAGGHELVLARLRPGRRYDYRVIGTPVGGTFTTDTLPADLARVARAATGTPTAPLFMLHLYDPAGFTGYAIVDGDGEVVWYWRTRDVPFGIARLPGGDFVVMDKGRGLLELAPDGRVIHELAQDTVAREMHHDAIVTPEGTVLFIAFDTRVVAGAKVKGEAIWEWDRVRGTATRRWSAWDFFSPAVDRGPRFTSEWMHANALALGPRGNVLLSVHYWNQILSIAPGWQTVEWRLGGVNATIPLGAAQQFSGQHSVREVSPGRLLLFDNAIERGGSSRALSLQLEGDSARTVWEWSPTPPNLATAVGTARRLANGNVVVGFGMSAGLTGSTGPIEVYEVTDARAVAWHLVLGGAYLMYRAEPLESVAGESEVAAP